MFSVLLSCSLLQAENEADQMDWIEKITGVITSLLQAPEVVINQKDRLMHCFIVFMRRFFSLRVLVVFICEVAVLFKSR